MSDRFQKLYSFPQKSLYLEGSPVVIAAGALLKDNATGRALAQLKFTNIDRRVLKAMKISIRAFDVFGAELPGVSGYQCLDLNVKCGDSFGSKSVVPLPNPDTRSISCSCDSVVFANGETWEAGEGEWLPIPAPVKLEDHLHSKDLADQYRRDTFAEAKYAVTEENGVWRCACGAVIPSRYGACWHCNHEKAVLAERLNEEKLKSHLDAHNKKLADEKAAAEEAEALAKKKRKKRTAVALLVIFLALASAAAAYLVPYFLANKKADAGDFKSADKLLFLKPLTEKHDPQLLRYVEALGHLEEGQFETASGDFAKLPGYKDADRLALESLYRLADRYHSKGDLSNAEYTYSMLAKKNYEDSDQLLGDVRFDTVKDCVKRGDFRSAAAILKDLVSKNHPGALEYEKELAADRFANDDLDIANTLYSDLAEKGVEGAGTQLDEVLKAQAEKHAAAGNYLLAVSIYRDLASREFPGASDAIKDTTVAWAESLVKQKDFDGAIRLYDGLIAEGVKGLKNKQREVRYKKAEALLKAGDVSSARAVFVALASEKYSDSQDRVDSIDYDSALSQAKAGDFSNALAIMNRLKESGYKNADAGIGKIRGLQYDYYINQAKNGNFTSALRGMNQLKKDGYSKAKDGITQIRSLQYDSIISDAKKGNYESALAAMRQLKKDGYSKAKDGIKEIKNLVKTKVENGSKEYIDFWKSEYDLTGSSKDYDYYLLSIHNMLSKYSKDIEQALSLKWYKDAAEPYFKSIKTFYKALKKSSFKDRCKDQCYDYLRLYGKWTGSFNYYFQMKNDDYISYNLPHFTYGDYYYLYDHEIRKYPDGEKWNYEVLFRFEFTSDSSMVVDGVYKLTKQN